MYCVIVDIDGTLADHSLRAKFAEEGDWERYHKDFESDPVHEAIRQIVTNFNTAGHKIVICTGRPEKYRDRTVDWLAKHSIPWDSLVMREDNSDEGTNAFKRRIAAEVSKEFPVLCVIEDRPSVVEMWREEGFFCLQVDARNRNPRTVQQILEDSLNLHKKKSSKYRRGYRMHGYVVDALFPDGISLKGPDDFNRWGIFNHMITKMVRYANNFSNGGHRDSLDDNIVYSAMLEEVDEELRKRKKDK